MPAPGARQVVFVVGPGRSGTSAVTGVLERVGLHAPGPHVTADDTNPLGFGEPRWVVDLHRRLLRRAQVLVVDARPAAWARCQEVGAHPKVGARIEAWLEEQLATHPRLVVKDPRLAWFIDAWTPAAERCGASVAYLTMLRSPVEVLGSRQLHYRNALRPISGMAQWLNLMLGTERLTRGSPRTWVPYHDLLADPVQAVRRAGEALQVESARSMSPRDEAAVRGFIDPALRRSTTSWDSVDVPPDLAALARETWEVFSGLAQAPDDHGVVAALGECWDRYERMYSEAEALTMSTAIAWQTKALVRKSPRGVAAGVRRRVSRLAGGRPTQSPG